MNIEEKYAKLRTAVIALVGVEDNPAVLRQMKKALDLAAPADDEDAAVTRRVLDVLIETAG